MNKTGDYMIFSRQHQKLMAKGGFYSKWHGNKYANMTHWVVIVMFFLVSVSWSYYLTFYSQKNFPAKAAALLMPEIKEPFDGNIVISKRPTISWSAVSGANAYKVRLYRDDNLLTEKIVNTTSYTPDFDLSDKSNFYWQVQALYVTDSTRASLSEANKLSFVQEVQAKRKTPATVPSVPTMLAPTANQHFQDGTISFDWSDVTNTYPPVSYYFQLSNSSALNSDGSFQTTLISTGNLSSSSYTYSGLVPGTYFWHVRSMNSGFQKSNWSTSLSFVVDSATQPTPDPVPAPPEPTPPTIPVQTITAESMFSPYWNFATDFSRTTNFLMPDPSVRWIGAAIDSGSATPSIESFETLTGKKHQVKNGFKSFYWVANFSTSDAQSAYNTGHHYVLTWEPWNPGAGATQAQYTNNAIITNQSFINGSGVTEKFDDYITRYAQQIKAYKKPVYIRFAHEMNGNWYPWGTVSGNTQATYVAMWKHVHNIFTTNNVKNVRWVWNANNEPVSSLAGYYPGDAFVDVASLDGYNWGNTKTWSSWNEFNNIFGSAITSIQSFSKKDIWIIETGSVESGGSKANWISNGYTVAKNNYPRLKNIMWFNQGDWSVNTSSTSLNAYKSAIQNF